jgi:23S rRNA (cytidine1920-2'-O)/16S rRNA (cytidine1409-2'-O)-methyltransferase
MSRQSRRADLALVERGFFDSRAKAQAAIAAGGVTADGRPVRKPSDPLAEDAAIVAEAAHPWVSRGGLKLAAGLDAFGYDAGGRICLDIGASTGGFTQVLLARGAARVYAVDVGCGQLHPAIAADPRVVALEGTDARRLGRSAIPDPVDLVVADVSFISLKLVLPPALRLCAPAVALVALIKPQFEAGRAQLRKGIVRDAAVHQAVSADLAGFVAGLGFAVAGIVPSPIVGGDGNREFLIGARRG